MAETSNQPLLALPAELLQRILSSLSPESLATVSGTCRLLYHHGRSDLLWQNLVQDNVPGVRLTSPFPCPSFRELYIAHYPRWFLSKNRVWFSDATATGNLIIVRYDPRRGSIEGYRLVAQRCNIKVEYWENNPEVVAHTFNPRLQLHLDEPVLTLDPTPTHSEYSQCFLSETPLPAIAGTIYSNFLLARHIPPTLQVRNMALWPPSTIPALQRVRNESRENFRGHAPKSIAQVSDQTFRIRRWMQFMTFGQSGGVRMGEFVMTFSTLMPELWTPTEQKPWRGIWVGDYSGHGCEFLLLHQPDAMSQSLTLSEGEGEGERGREEDDGGDNGIYQGRLEAIKLTGDPNIPRGEYSWIAEDIGKGGFLRVAEEEMFRGARIVKSKGHVASEGFRDDRFLPSQLIMISPNKLAQYWESLKCITFFERVNIERFLHVD
ncbi:MAG: hypothetical protein M1839_007366 [Geoglossum umbratile]|nr:MAG: hypothetical protein M1839_007366 [Geoglossum umbratile]